MDFNAPDAELAGLIRRPDTTLSVVGVANNGRVNPVQLRLQREQPQISPFIRNNLPVLPSNGGYKKKRTKKIVKNITTIKKIKIKIKIKNAHSKRDELLK
jgi:hypothetical protein